MKPATKPSQRPPDARLLVVHPDGAIEHTARSRFAEYLTSGDLVVANDAATLPASLHGVHVPTGEIVEIRLAGRRSLAPDDVQEFVAVVFGPGDHRTLTEDRPLPPVLRAGDVLALGPLRATVLGTLGHPRLVAVRFAGSPDAIWAGIAAHGRPIQYAHLEEPLAMWDVWTSVASLPAAFEPPSAGFLLDWKLLTDLKARGIDFATLTHAAGISSTGDPELDARLPLDEPYSLSDPLVESIERAKKRGARIIALGTTVTRALEHAAADGILRAGDGLATQRLGADTLLRVVDGIVTGTHEPTDSHYDVLRAFVDTVTLERMSAALEQAGYRTHEFGDSVMIAQPPHQGVPTQRACGALGSACQGLGYDNSPVHVADDRESESAAVEDRSARARRRRASAATPRWRHGSVRRQAGRRRAPGSA